MAALHPNRAVDKRVLGYGFAGVVLDLRRQTLSVDGAEVPSTPLMLRLLQLLCEADGHLLKRPELFDRLWPGGQDVSDSALSQLIWRLRTALGPYADLVATVRGSGLRLDAAVSTELDFQRGSSKVIDAESTPAPRLVDATTIVVAVPESAPTSRPRRRWLAAIAAAVLMIVGVAAWLIWPRDPIVNTSYALRVSDLAASRPDTGALINAAFAAQVAGETSHATTLLRGVHESDSTTPIPALILAWWESDESGTQPDWIALARKRFTPQTTPYVRLLADYFEARRNGVSMRGPVNALLDLRPQAWTLQYARAHDQLGARELSGALRSMQQISIDTPAANTLAEILTDRVSLGDSNAEALALKLPSITQDPVLDPFVRGRFAYSRGELRAAIEAFDRARDAAQTQRAYTIERDAAIYAALAALESSAPDAARRVDAAARLCHEQDAQLCEVEMLGFESYVHARAGDIDLASTALATAWKRSQHDFERVPLLFVAFENGLAPPGDVEPIAAAMPSDAVFGGVPDLMRAWQSEAGGDAARARKMLDLAREHGIERTYHAEDALLLGARLGESVTPCRVDPPFPNVLRLSACIGLRKG